jgi:hypothetical protein
MNKIVKWLLTFVFPPTRTDRNHPLVQKLLDEQHYDAYFVRPTAASASRASRVLEWVGSAPFSASTIGDGGIRLFLSYEDRDITVAIEASRDDYIYYCEGNFAEDGVMEVTEENIIEVMRWVLGDIDSIDSSKDDEVTETYD